MTEEDTITPLPATSLWSLRSQGLRVPKIKTTETERPCDDAITPLSATSLWSLRSQGRKVPKKSLPLNCNLKVLTRPLVNLNPLAVGLLCAMQHLNNHLKGCSIRNISGHRQSVGHDIYI